MSSDFFKSFSPKGRAKMRRILLKEYLKEYQKYLMGCLKTGEKALQFELWQKKFGKRKGGRR